MKMKFATKLMAFVAIVLVIGACKDDDEKKLSDEATFDGATIELTSALTMLDWNGRDDDGTTVHDHDITFFSEGITLDEGAEASGSGDAITFKAVSTVQDVLGAGTYSITDDVEGEAAAFTYHDAAVIIGLSPGSSEGTRYKIVSGLLKSIMADGSQKYEFEGTVEGGKTLKFVFSGDEWIAEKD
jgi:hypothetical protein